MALSFNKLKYFAMIQRQYNLGLFTTAIPDIHTVPLFKIKR